MKTKTLFLTLWLGLVGFLSGQDRQVDWLLVTERLEWNTLTTTERNALTGLTSGEPVIIFNETTAQYEFSNDAGSSWTALGGAGSTLPVADTVSLVEGSGDDTKLLRFEIDGITTGTTRVITMADADISLVPGVTFQGTDADLDDLADGTLSAGLIDAAITRDTEWDTAAEINAATTDQDFLLADALGVTVQGYDADLADLADGTLTGTKVGVMTGDSGAGGAIGAVPAPSAGDAAAGRYLKADGTWDLPGGTEKVAFSYTLALAGSPLLEQVYYLCEAPVAMTVTKVSGRILDSDTGAMADFSAGLRKDTTSFGSLSIDNFDGMSGTGFDGWASWTGSTSVTAGQDLNVQVSALSGAVITYFQVTIYGTVP